MAFLSSDSVSAETTSTRNIGASYTPTGYGVDVSFPMHHFPKPSSAGAKLYEWFMSGCGAAASRRQCEANEASRMEMNREQICRQRNYTALGFAKLRAPKAAYHVARSFWDKHQTKSTTENWPPGNTYVNNWLSPTKMVSFEDQRFQPEGLKAKQVIWDSVRPVLEAWTGQRLKPTSLYGIRVYEKDAVLATHVDRLPLVTSAILQIDQDVEEPWPIEVVGHDGLAYNVTLEPGEMALYESHTVLHGRPRPLRGNFFANVFVHFIPVAADGKNNEPGIDFEWSKKARRRSSPHALHFPEPPPFADSLRAAVEAAQLDTAALRAQVLFDREEGHQVAGNEDFGRDAFATGSTTALHVAAAAGDLPGVKEQLERSSSDVNAADVNLWTPLHEAARGGGDASIVKYLVEHGADLGARTISGASALNLARQHKQLRIVEYLESIGAPDFADEL